MDNQIGYFAECEQWYNGNTCYCGSSEWFHPVWSC